VTLVLDSGGVSALASDRARLFELRRRGHLPAQVPTIVLTEALAGDPRRDFAANRLLRLCQVRDVSEPTAREAARLRTATRRASKISATDAVVVAFASTQVDPVVLTSDVRDLAALAESAVRSVAVVGV
jgi:predicted nucleic acid-binding protein